MQLVARAAFRQFGTRMGNTELLHHLQKETEKRSASAKSVYDDFVSRHPDTAALWREIEGETVHSTIVEGRYSDLIVLCRASSDSEYSTDVVANILVGCGRPLLLVPDMPPHTIGSTIAVAWKESAEAARAVTGAMPLLARAKRVFVVTVREEGAEPAPVFEPAERLAGQLKKHGLPAEGHSIVSGGHAVPNAVLQSARESGADLIVMGAYSHSRFRELVFGGFTRQVLQSCDLPVLLLH